MAIVGHGGGVYIGPTPGTKVAEIANWSLDTDAEELDITNFDSGGWQEIMQGIKSWSGSFEGNFKPDDTQGQAALITAWINGETVTLELRVNSTIKFSGNAYVKPSIETPVDDKVSISFDFTGTGPLTPTLSEA